MTAESSEGRSRLVALALVPPQDKWPPIQEIRRQFARSGAFKRWPPHINLCWPFLPASELPAAIDVLKEAMSSVAPFSLKLEDFSTFVRGKDATMFLEVHTPELAAVHASLIARFPEMQDTRGFHGHLTVGSLSDKRSTIQELSETHIAEFQKTWKPDEFLVDHLTILVAPTLQDPFEVFEQIPFGDA
eukprot:TRINITY_DN5657_c0_g1_i2.p1 TRINITY_DN5657_c0_g1~~TRINITY_DN5657_c0_g1_i2.p1  ORF type:complete len:188 (+),score=29.37 TRINITY_DN5657_c0_g1_i2:62-625(+)